MNAPNPSIKTEDANRCPGLRRLRDLQLARWCDLTPAETRAFIDYATEYDRRTPLYRGLFWAQETAALAERVEEADRACF